MKKLWQAIDISIISFAVAIVFVGVTAAFNLILAAVELVCCAVLFAIRLNYVMRKKQRLLFQVQTVAKELDFEQGSAFEQLVVPCTAILKSGHIIWFNTSFEKTFGITKKTPLCSVKQILKRENIDRMLEGRGFRLKVENQYFAVYSAELNIENDKVYLLYFFEETKLRLVEKEYYDTRLSIMLCVIDNAEEIYQTFKESECAAVFSALEQKIDNWASAYGGLCRKYSNARMLIIAEERSLQKMINDKFSILDEIREMTYNGKSCEVTLSLGVGKEGSMLESNNSAKLALDMAQSRGGDQVAIRHDAQYKFYGGVSQGFEKRNKVRTRLIAKAIAEIIKDSDRIAIMGHRFSDFDSFGSAVGMYTIAKHFSKDAKIVVDKGSSLATPLIDKVCAAMGEDILLGKGKAEEYVDENTLLIVVDTHKKDFCEIPELVDKAGKVMVIDHHRKSVSFIENTVMFYHMSTASSASEMVAEISEYIDTKPFVDSLTAQALFAGIMLDTRNFIIRTGVRTFEAAAYLRSRSASTIEAKKLFSNDMDIFNKRNTVIDNARIYKEHFAISFADFESKNIRLITSQAADEMLNIEKVKASFVLYKNGDGVNISARSYGDINVQLIMESLGGGGHQAMSACQIPSVSEQQAIQKLEKAINKYINNKTEAIK